MAGEEEEKRGVSTSGVNTRSSQRTEAQTSSVTRYSDSSGIYLMSVCIPFGKLWPPNYMSLLTFPYSLHTCMFLKYV